MKSIAQRISKLVKHELKDPYLRAFLLLWVIGACIRLINFPGFVTFLGDQGRDVIILKRIVTFEHLPAVGATSSVGGVFLGPFYYYLIAPWLLLFNFNPIGPAVGVAILSLVSIIVIYFMTWDLFNKQIALIVSILFLFTHVIVEAARFSWNPNLLPYFSFFTIYFFIKALKTNKKMFYFVSGAFLSMCMQLHYITLALCAPLALAGILSIFKTKKPMRRIFQLIILCLGFVTISAPLIIFDIRHGLINYHSFTKVVFNSDGTGQSWFDIKGLVLSFAQFQSYLITFKIGESIAITILLGVVALTIYSFSKNKKIAFISLTFIFGFFMTHHFTGQKLSHYFGALYPYYFILIAYAIYEFLWIKKLKYFIPIILVVFMLLQSHNYYFLYGTPNYQINHAEHISKAIFDNVTSDSYQVSGIPDYYDDNTYRYFLELWGKRPLAKDSLEKGTEMFAVCERSCEPLKAPQWSITFFKPNKIVGQWEVEGVTIYKLTN